MSNEFMNGLRRIHHGVLTRRKRSLEPALEVTLNRYPTRKRVKRSDSVSSQKENSEPLLNEKSKNVDKHLAGPLKTRNFLYAIKQKGSTSSVIKPISTPLFLPPVNSHKNEHVSSTDKVSPTTVHSRRKLRKTRHTVQSATNAQFKVTPKDVCIRDKSNLRLERVSSSTHSSPNISPSDVSTLDTNLAPWFSPNHYHCVSKQKTTKLKRPNTRKIEFDIEELTQSIDKDASHLSTESLLNQSIVGDPVEKLLGLCGQTEVKPFEECFDSCTLDGIVKIGEGVYGEVFQSAKGRVIKIFPVDGEQIVNGEKQMTFAEVYPEVFVSKKLSELAYKYRRNRSVNFAQLKKATVAQGVLPEAFSSSWRKFKAQRGSENECPDFLPSTQQWIILEFEFAGEPLANMRFNTCREARSVIEQITLSLAAAESALQFEHRDLHWHNILVRPTRHLKLRYRVGGVSYVVFTEGIQVTIIDFTVSRLCHEGNIVYVDMADYPEIFACDGDYQFDIYRMMQDLNGNDWRPFNPITNLYWLHYLMRKLLNETSYPRRDPDSQPVESELRALYDMILTSDYKSTLDLVNSSFYFDSCRIG